jgi:hypothetical protein
MMKDWARPGAGRQRKTVRASDVGIPRAVAPAGPEILYAGAGIDPMAIVDEKFKVHP